MTIGLIVGMIVETSGILKYFEYDNEHYDNDKLDVYVENKGRGEYELLDEEIINEEGEKLWVFGYKEGEERNKNKSEIVEEQDIEIFGDIIFVKVDKDNNPLDIKEDDFKEVIPHNLDDFSDNDSHLGENNEYDFSDGWLINDLEEIENEEQA